MNNAPLTEQYDLFAPQHITEYQRWLASPPGTMAPWVVRELQAKPRQRA